MLQRRDLLKWTGGALLGLALPCRAHAHQLVALTLDQLARRSHRVAVMTSLGGEGRWENVGGQRRIVTYCQVRVDEAIDDDSGPAELTVRTLGGRVGDIGQIVHGAARLLRGRPSVLFLRELGTDLHAVTGMAQGHFPLQADARGEARLRMDPGRGDAIAPPGSAARVLAGRRLPEASHQIREAWRRAR